jgi:hypothetical protein
LPNVYYLSTQEGISSFTHNATTSSLKSVAPRPPIHWNSSWLGNEWHPDPTSGHKLYSPFEIKEYFSNTSVLIVGDSTARRQFATWYALINASNPNDVTMDELDSVRVIDVNKGIKVEEAEEGYLLTRKSTMGARCDLYNSVCLHSIEADLQPDGFLASKLSLYSIVVFIFGAWETDGKLECFRREHGRRNSTQGIMDRLNVLVDEFPNTKFVWRTWAGSASDAVRSGSWKNSQVHNHFMKTLIHSFQKERYELHDMAYTRISYIDFGHAMSPRVFPNQKRIMGDINAHFGFEARSAFIQMWMNHMIDLERQETNHIAPGWTVWSSTDNAKDCYHAGGNDMYCLSDAEITVHYELFLTISDPPEVLNETEKREYDRAKADYCSNCTSSSGIICDARLMYFQGNYKMSESKALIAVARDPGCNRSSTMTN